MTSQIESILRVLFDEDEALPFPDCAPCQDQLTAYIDAQLAGADAAAAFPDVSAHLAGCATCSRVHDELAALLALEQSDQLAAPPVPAAFDFSYLPTPAVQQDPTARPAVRPWRVDAVGRLIVQFSAELLRSLQGPALQPSYLKSDMPRALTWEIEGEVDDLTVRVNAEASRRDPQAVDVEVEVEVPSRGGWPNLAGSIVALSVEENEFGQEETDAFGKALFEGVPADVLPGLMITVTPVSSGG